MDNPERFEELEREVAQLKQNLKELLIYTKQAFTIQSNAIDRFLGQAPRALPKHRRNRDG